MGSPCFEKETELRRIDIERQRTFTHKGANFLEVFREVVRDCPDQPFYFLDETDLAERAQIFQNEFLPGCDQQFIAYAVKANPLPRIVEILASVGIKSFDCASLGEVNRVRSIVGDAVEIFYNNPSRGSGQAQKATDLGVRHFTIDKPSEQLFEEMADLDEFDLSLRINPRASADSTAQIRLGEKYGLKILEGARLVQQMAEREKVRVGVSMHIGSQNFNPQEHAFQIAVLRDTLEGVGMTELSSFNIGGGIPVDGKLSKKENTKILSAYLSTLGKDVWAIVERVLLADGKCIIEPGRSMIAPAVDLIVPVNAVTKKEGSDPVVSIEDGIFTSFSDRVIHDWEYEFGWLNKVGQEIQGAKINSTLHGRSCDSGDRISNVPVPENLTAGDYLWCRNAGAYMSCQSTAFNGFNPHPYITYNPI